MFILRKMNVIQPVRFSFKIVVNIAFVCIYPVQPVDPSYNSILLLANDTTDF